MLGAVKIPNRYPIIPYGRGILEYSL
jgi:hypothetical protein